MLITVAIVGVILVRLRNEKTTALLMSLLLLAERKPRMSVTGSVFLGHQRTPFWRVSDPWGRRLGSRDYTGVPMPWLKLDPRIS